MLSRLALTLLIYLAAHAAHGQAYAPAPGGAAPIAAVTPAAPEGFELNPMEQAYLDQVLAKWEQQSAAVQNFRCDFTRWEYNMFGPSMEVAATVGEGELSYQQPDKGSFRIKSLKRWQAEPVQPGHQGPPQGKYVADQNAILEHWVCDGAAIYEFKTEQKELHVRNIPPDMQGKRIVDGPLPFLFGAEAAKLKARYWLKVVPTADQEVIHLAAKPKFQADAANYSMVEIRMDRVRLMPMAMQVWHPDQSRTSYVFDMAKADVNSRVTAIFGALFQSPKTPWGWKRVVEEATPSQAIVPSETR